MVDAAKPGTDLGSILAKADFHAPADIKVAGDVSGRTSVPILRASGGEKIEAAAARAMAKQYDDRVDEMCANKDVVEKAQAYLKADAKLTASLMELWPKRDAFNNMITSDAADYSDQHTESLQSLEEEVKIGQDYSTADDKVKEANKVRVAAENSLQASIDAAFKKAYPGATDEEKDEVLQGVLSVIQEKNLENSGANKNKDAAQAPPDNSGQQRTSGQGFTRQ
jgi:hypothetical protein